jgi:D-alanine-D-alanine ligase
MQFYDMRRDIPVLLLHNLNEEWTGEERLEAAGAAETLASALREFGHPVVNVPVTDGDLSGLVGGFDREGCIVLNWCEELPGIAHGDARVAEILEENGFTYTGSPASILAMSWQKETIKEINVQRGLPTPRGHVYRTSRVSDWRIFPAIVKPACEHCSHGITSEAVVLDGVQLRERVQYVLDVFGKAALVEEFIDGREFHVSLWGNETVELLPPAEMNFDDFGDVRDRLCTYEAKFLPGSRHYEGIRTILPAPLTDTEFQDLSRIAIAAYQAHGCRDYARLDIRLRDGVFYILDVNPNPDLSADASMACAAEIAGISYGALGSRLVNLASPRHHVFGVRPR